MAYAFAAAVRIARVIRHADNSARQAGQKPIAAEDLPVHGSHNPPARRDQAAAPHGVGIADRLRPLKAVRRWLRARWKLLSSIGLVLLTLYGLLADTLGIGSFLAGRIPPQATQATTVPVRMLGDFNIAVARLSVADGVSSPPPEIDGLAETLAERLAAELSALQPATVEVWPPARTGDLADPSPEVRAARMQTRARVIHADIIVSGVVRPAGNGITVSAELYLSERQLPNAWELVGRHEFPGLTRSFLPSSFSGAFRSELRAEIAERTRGLTRFVVGISAYAEGDYQEARRQLTAAQRDWNTPDGRAMLALFLGNIAGKLGDYELASRHYTAVIRARPGDGRALLGQAELAYHRARGTCEHGSGVDPGGLAEALRRYGVAAQAAHRPAGTDIDAKTALGRGRVYLCLSQAEAADNWTLAEAEFLTVTHAYEAGNQRIRGLASEAYANLGLIYLPPDGIRQAADAYRRAAAAYERAIELSDAPQRQGVFYGMLGHIYGRLGDQPRATDAYGKAAELDPTHAPGYQRAARTIREGS